MTTSQKSTQNFLLILKWSISSDVSCKVRLLYHLRFRVYIFNFNPFSCSKITRTYRPTRVESGSSLKGSLNLLGNLKLFHFIRSHKVFLRRPSTYHQSNSVSPKRQEDLSFFALTTLLLPTLHLKLSSNSSESLDRHSLLSFPPSPDF